MARTRVYTAILRVETMAMATKLGEKVLTELQLGAKENATGGPYSRGALAASIYKHGPIAAGTTVTGTVGSRLDYANIVEVGAKIHDIFPKGAPHVYRFGRHRRPMLRFVWRGKLVYMHQIPGSPTKIGLSHPGQRGKHYIAKALVGVAARNGFRVAIYDI
jgi:hypothetical protein